MSRCLLLLVLLVPSTLWAADLEPRAGEPVNGFPSWSERVIHQWINRARVEPQAELRGCGATCGDAPCYSPKPPLSWSEALNRAARFHADEMLQQGYFAHDSACAVVNEINALYPAGCDGAASCACTGGSIGCKNGPCTPWNQRVALFGAGGSAEIIAGTGDPNYAFYLWLWEPFAGGECGFNAMNGHRYVMLEYTGSIGIGIAGNRSVGDFSWGGTPYRIPSGTHYPQQADTVEMWANWYDARPPRSASVVVGGRCIPMKLSRGTGTNGAWSATVDGVGNGCHRYYFSFIDANGAEVTYPASGSLGIGPCEDWTSARTASRCSGSSSSASRRRAVRR